MQCDSQGISRFRTGQERERSEKSMRAARTEEPCSHLQRAVYRLTHYQPLRSQGSSALSSSEGSGQRNPALLGLLVQPRQKRK